MPTLSPDQLAKLSEITNPLVRRRFTIFYQLPPDLQGSMLAERTAESIWNILKEKYNLPNASISATAKVIGLIFLGELPIKNFIAALKNDLGVDVAKAQAIAQDINLAIFQPVRESLMEVHGLERGLTPSQTRTDADGQGEIRNPKSEIRNNIQRPAGQMSNSPLRQDQGRQFPISVPTEHLPQGDNKFPNPNDQNGEAERKRAELLEKLKAQQNNRAQDTLRPPIQPPVPPSNPSPPRPGGARPASYAARRNVVDLRYTKRRSGYNGFFSS